MCTASVGSGGLVCRMKKALEKEQRQWDHWMSRGLHKGDRLVTVGQRNNVMNWLFNSSEHLNFALDTLALAAVIMDRVLFTTKVKRKYLQTLTVASLYVACKICEEPESLPPLKDLVLHMKCNSSVKDMIRMERVILKRLNWDLSLVTPHTFFQLMLAVAVPQICQTFSNESRTLFRLIFSNYDVSSTYRPSVLALATFSILLENRPDPNWSAMTSQLEELLGVSNGEHIVCREHIMSVWQRHNNFVPETENKRQRINGFGRTSTKELRSPVFEDVTYFSNECHADDENDDDNNGDDGGRVTRKSSVDSLSIMSRCSTKTGVVEFETVGLRQSRIYFQEMSISDIYDANDVLYEITV